MIGRFGPIAIIKKALLSLEPIECLDHRLCRRHAPNGVCAAYSIGHELTGQMMVSLNENSGNDWWLI